MIKTLKTFYSFIFKRKLLFLIVLVLIVIASILSSVSPYFYKLIVEAIPSMDSQKMLSILLIYIGISFLALIFDTASFWVGDVILFSASSEARSAIFKKVQELDFAFHTNKSTGSLISIFKRGDSAFFTLYLILHFRFLSILTSMAVMFFFFFRISITATIIMVVSFLIAALLTKFLISNNVKKRTAFNTEEDNISGIIVDNMINYETVKLFAREKWEHSRLVNAFIPWKKALWGYGNSFRLIDVSIGTLTNLSIFFILYTAINISSKGKLSVGDFVLITGLISSFFPRVWEFVWNSRDIAKNYADIEKYMGLLDNQVEVKDPESPVKIDSVHGVIEFDRINFNYTQRTKNAINNLSLKIKEGESVAFVGRSGSGKTTLVKLLMRFFDLKSGNITIDGIDIKNFNKSDLRSLIGVVPQEPILFNNTIAYNIGYGFKGRTLKGGSEEGPTLLEVRRSAKIANIDAFIESLPDKYETEVGERGVKLSGGQKQRLAIARMILSNPDIVVFDEATSHLDSESEKLIQDAFWKARAGKTTIIVAHRLSTVMRADKIVVMEKGQIKEIGTHEELLKNKESLYSHFWNLQIKLD